MRNENKEETLECIMLKHMSYILGNLEAET